MQTGLFVSATTLTIGAIFCPHFALALPLDSPSNLAEVENSVTRAEDAYSLGLIFFG
jgi:hypothetical protein